MKYWILCGTAFALLGVSACSKTKEQFDFSKKAPDEFQVTTRAPLELPPDYSLRPPRPGAPRPQEVAPADQAKQTVFGLEDMTPQSAAPVTQQSLSTGESILLQKGGTDSIDPDIRSKVDAETSVLVEKNTSTVDKILGKAGKDTDVPATVVDPVKESERIMRNKEDGKPVTEGDTPSIEQ